MPTYTHSIPIGAGAVTIGVSLDLFAADEADRAFVFKVIDLVRRHERARAEARRPLPPAPED